MTPPEDKLVADLLSQNAKLITVIEELALAFKRYSADMVRILDSH